MNITVPCDENHPIYQKLVPTRKSHHISPENAQQFQAGLVTIFVKNNQQFLKYS